MLLLIQDRGGAEEQVGQPGFATTMAQFSTVGHVVFPAVHHTPVGWRVGHCDVCVCVLSVCYVEPVVLKLTLPPFSLCGQSATCTVLQRSKTQTFVSTW